MVLQLNVPPEIEDRLRQEAERQGVSPDMVTIALLNQHLPPVDRERRDAAVAMLQQWAAEDAEMSDEAVAENAAVLRSLDEHRASYRKLFENVLKDPTSDSSGAA